MRERKQNLRSAAFELARREGATENFRSRRDDSEDDVRYVHGASADVDRLGRVENPGGKAHRGSAANRSRVIEKICHEREIIFTRRSD